MDAAETAGDAKDRLLHEDRRLLGRLLGEVIREQAGAATLERIERIRQTAVRFRRSELDPALAGEAAAVKAELEGQLDALPIDETLHVVRAVSTGLTCARENQARICSRGTCCEERRHSA